eukprot:CAMPEP_0202959726 /NCGR_PEP_ID=MMETSP1396-20130829/3899_1 /ASSEMBLY_ACC=CAM_ASM_000872 /TAXON_ID= /ORGANISM="Pseudokeronopsis sp., Strain Brazil" /LENGTH=159 /DNA_ID=CAMNT_0049678443 /DNA_START=607 /DNA_END=1086 /DNA_ORIENTATION=+
MEENDKKQQITLKYFIEKKPQLGATITQKLDRVVGKFLDKGLVRHSIIQAILFDYLETNQEFEKIKDLIDPLKEIIPALLATKQGLYVACSLFTIMDAKDRKIVIKSLGENMKEMLTNKIGHLFIVHVLNTLDDTLILKKKIIAEMIKNIEELIQDKCY